MRQSERRKICKGKRVKRERNMDREKDEREGGGADGGGGVDKT